jgi:hypothetical protein
LVALAYAGQKYYVANTDGKVRMNAIGTSGANERMRIDNEGVLIRGTLQNQSDSISNRAQVQNRSLGISESAEDRQSRALEYHRQEQERRSSLEWSRQQANERQRAESARAQTDRAEAARVERQKRYDACVASAIGTTGSLDKARQRCMGYM